MSESLSVRISALPSLNVAFSAVACVSVAMASQPALTAQVEPISLVSISLGQTLKPVSISVGQIWPQLVSSEDEVPYSKRVDVVGDTIIYIGEADPGTEASDSAWRIRRLTFNTEGDTVTEWANGSAAFSFQWNERLTLSYS